MTDTTDPLGLACEHGMLPRACEVCFAAMLRELDSHPGSGRLMHASPKAESASENAELLADLDYAAQGIARMDRLDAEIAAAAIRALEAKAAAAEAALQELLARIHRDGGHYATEHGLEKAAEDADAIVAELFADRDRLAAEVGRQRLQIETMRAEYNARAGMHMLAAEEAERLGLELAAASENEARYLWLREHGDFGCTEKDGYGGQQLMIGERLDTAVDAARRAGEGEV